MRKRPAFVSVVLISVLIALAACAPAGDGGRTSASPSPPGENQKIVIFHAGSLTVPVKKLSEAFEKKHPGVEIDTEASGSVTAARKISELGRKADVMMSADYTVIDRLLVPQFADWNIQFARNMMVIAYTEKSKYAAEITPDNWYDVLTRDGVVYGHSDPNADPCGYRTLMVWQLAEKYYGVPGLYQRLQDHCPPGNIRPKAVELLSLLQSGDMDYAFEYRSVAVQHNLKFVELPDEINLSQDGLADYYKQARVQINGRKPGEKVIKVGKPIVYGVTVPKNAPHHDLGVEFVEFLLSKEGQEILESLGQPPLVPPVAVTGRDKLPLSLKSLVR